MPSTHLRVSLPPRLFNKKIINMNRNCMGQVRSLLHWATGRRLGHPEPGAGPLLPHEHLQDRADRPI